MSEYQFIDYIITEPEYITRVSSIVIGYVPFGYIAYIINASIIFPIFSSMTAFNVQYILLFNSVGLYVRLLLPVDKFSVYKIYIIMSIYYIFPIFNLIVLNVIYSRWNLFVDQVDKSEENMMTMIHDMKNPLIACEYLIESLEEGRINKRTKEFLSKIKIELKEIYTYLENYRFFYKETKSNEVNEKEADIDIDETFQNIMMSNKRNCMNNKNKLEVYKCFDHPEQIRTKPIIFKRIINNLVSNALKHCSGKTVQLGIRKYKSIKDMYEFNNIHLDQEQLQDNHPIYAIEVIDNGNGIRQELQNNLFDAKSTSNIEQNYDGTGIGLSVAKYLAQQTNGDIVFYSYADEETKFIYYFHDQKQKELENNSIQLNHKNKISISTCDFIDSNTSDNIIEFKHACYPILFAEDNNVIKKMYTKMCKKLNLDHFGFTHGLDLINFIEAYYSKDNKCKICSNKILVLSDNQMPIMNGLELHNYISRNDYLKSIVTFYLITADEIEFEGNYIPKPLKKSKLQEVFKEFRISE